VTARARVSSLPDETPIGDLPLRQYTINALRAGGVLTLGDLRLMRDHDLLRLRLFGRGSLAEVRSLVPAPEGERR
jgi:DNA-directed RNA polymerase alpha subunit